MDTIQKQAGNAFIRETWPFAPTVAHGSDRRANLGIAVAILSERCAATDRRRAQSHHRVTHVCCFFSRYSLYEASLREFAPSCDAAKPTNTLALA